MLMVASNIRMIAAALVVWLSGAVAAEETVLTVIGLSEVHRFTLADLRAMDTDTFETTTIWTEGSQIFTGVPLAYLVARLGVAEGQITAAAINDYSVSFPVAEARSPGPIIAFLRNGTEMPVREKGPLWLVYPYDADESFQTEVIHARSIWQLDRITFGTD